MSCFIVDGEHLDLLVNTAHCGVHMDDDGYRRWQVAWETTDPRGYADHRWAKTGEGQVLDSDELNGIGQMLLDANVRSVRARYEDADDVGMLTYFAMEGYTHRPAVRVTAVQALKAIASLNYQCCEAADWIDTEAYRFLHGLKDACIDALDGYDAAPWVWNRDTVRAQHSRLTSTSPHVPQPQIKE